ncbi:excalibur calcium-binding domain-containing protein [Nocardia sp. NPDC056100]|uniref:excalibur calcium-binding domain-containing protein n=1 Tax=Nocardia sp. NPDC056100 TaxID=3345712 RepID=UPI0035DE505E
MAAPAPVAPPAVPVPAAPVPAAPAVTYKSCAEAKAAGAAPLRRGDPGYSSRLDRDGDGIACER